MQLDEIVWKSGGRCVFELDILFGLAKQSFPFAEYYRHAGERHLANQLEVKKRLNSLSTINIGGTQRIESGE